MTSFTVPRVLHLGNTNNIGYFNVRFLRAAGVHADLVVDRTDHVSYQPAWVDPGPSPLWLRYYSTRVRHGFQLGKGRIPFPYGHRLVQLRDVHKLAGQYDLLQAYNYDPILCLAQRRVPVVAYCVGGDLNVTALSQTWIGTLLRYAYRRAAMVLYANIDMKGAVETLGLARARYIPLPVDTQMFRPPHPDEARDARRRLIQDVDFVCYSPARHDWAVKGNDRLIRAWKEVSMRCWAQGVKVLLVLSEWGRDLERSRGLVESLGLRNVVRWVPLVNRVEIRNWYWAADVVADQFVLGAFGLVALEGMSCGRPVLASADLSLAQGYYSDPPPIWVAQSSSEIVKALETLLWEPVYREAVGRAGREWVEEHHGPSIIVREHLKVYGETLESAGRCCGA